MDEEGRCHREQRAALVAELLARDGFDALLGRTLQHVLMLTGYLPVLGNTLCLVSLDRRGNPVVRLALPGAERNLLPDGAAGYATRSARSSSTGLKASVLSAFVDVF